MPLGLTRRRPSWNLYTKYVYEDRCSLKPYPTRVESRRELKILPSTSKTFKFSPLHTPQSSRKVEFNCKVQLSRWPYVPFALDLRVPMCHCHQATALALSSVSVTVSHVTQSQWWVKVKTKSKTKRKSSFTINSQTYLHINIAYRGLEGTLSGFQPDVLTLHCSLKLHI